MNLRRTLQQRVAAALAAAGAPDAPALVGPAARPQFGDYQANGVMAAAKALKTNPRQLAEKVVAALDLSDLAERVEVAGPGFINITLRNDWLAGRLAAAAADQERLGVEPPENPQTVVVDYSSPNLAKEMHVGHLRSTIIGDALARTLEFLGHRVVRQNHVGDWGTQFGMLIAHLEEVGEASSELADLEAFYRAAKERFDSDAAFAERSRHHVVRLQGGDVDVNEKWRGFLAVSLRHCEQVFGRLGVTLRREDVRGESAYNDQLPDVVGALESAGLLRESQGAQCVFPDGFVNKEGEPLPLIVQKSDGGYLYATTDLAAVRFRCGEGRRRGDVDWSADRVLYVVDSRQGQHFAMVFAVARAAGFAPAQVSLEHVGFGMMLGANKRPFKTREGGTVKLADLLDEAERRAFELVSDKNPDLPEAARRDIARKVGIGALKYADLSQNRNSDYVFSWDKMLSLEGNTAPYMQYAYARIRSIFRKGGWHGSSDPRSAHGSDRPRHPAHGSGDPWHPADGAFEPAERALAVKLVQFPEVVDAVAAECMPHLLCAYLFELAGAFTGFYENCPVLKADEPTRESRLALCELTARTIRTGLGLLGIETVEQM